MCNGMSVSTHGGQRLTSSTLHLLAQWILSPFFMCWDGWELSGIYMGARDLDHSPQASLESFLSTELRLHLFLMLSKAS